MAYSHDVDGGGQLHTNFRRSFRHWHVNRGQHSCVLRYWPWRLGSSFLDSPIVGVTSPFPSLATAASPPESGQSALWPGYINQQNPSDSPSLAHLFERKVLNMKFIAPTLRDVVPLLVLFFILPLLGQTTA